MGREGGRVGTPMTVSAVVSSIRGSLWRVQVTLVLDDGERRVLIGDTREGPGRTMARWRVGQVGQVPEDE